MIGRSALMAAAFAAILAPGASAVTIVFQQGYAPDFDYPQAAFDREIEGSATVTCDLKRDGRLIDCLLITETPSGLGFGAAAVTGFSRARVNVEASGLGDSVGATLTLPMAFTLDHPPPPLAQPAPPPPETVVTTDELFDRDAELTDEDRAARHVSSKAPTATSCPDGRNCGVVQ